MPEHFQTQNRKLAEALITAGCEFAPQPEGGPTLNLYTPSLLRERRILPRSEASLLQFEEAALAAVKSKIPGTVTFLFLRTEKLNRAIRAWDETADLIRMVRQWEELDDIQKQESSSLKPPDAPEISEDIVARVLCIHATNMKEMPAYIFANPAALSTIGGTYTPGSQPLTSTGIPAGETTGKGRVWRVTTSNADRAHMGIHPRIK